MVVIKKAAVAIKKSFLRLSSMPTARYNDL
jgi:hypothetical protein